MYMSDSENEVGISDWKLPLSQSIDSWSHNSFNHSIWRWI